MSVKVLVVDDERNLVKLLQGYLEREGFEMHEAADGQAAIEEARRVSPEVVVLDLNLPGSGGLDLLRRLQIEDSKVKVLIFSMHTTPLYVANGL